MKAIKIIFAVLAAFWALAYVPKLIASISQAGDPFVLSRVAGSILGIVLASAISILLFRSSFSQNTGNRMGIVVVIGLIAICLVAIVLFLGYPLINSYRGTANIPADLATRPWSEHQLFENSVIMDVPWPLNTNETAKGNSPNSQSYQGDGLYVFASSIQSSAGTDNTLDAAVDRFVALCRNSGTVESPMKTPISVMGDRAIELKMVLKKKWKPTSQFRGLFFIHNGIFCQIHCNSGLNQPVADAVWKRIEQSIRLRQAAATLPKAGITQGSPPLPPGMTRRPK